MLKHIKHYLPTKRDNIKIMIDEECPVFITLCHAPSFKQLEAIMPLLKQVNQIIKDESK